MSIKGFKEPLRLSEQSMKNFVEDCGDDRKLVLGRGQVGERAASQTPLPSTAFATQASAAHAYAKLATTHGECSLIA